MAERGGFEPPIPFKGYTGLANQRLQPLGHLSSAPIVKPARASGSRKFSVFSASHQPLPPAGPGLVTLRGQQPELRQQLLPGVNTYQQVRRQAVAEPQPERQGIEVNRAAQFVWH